MQRHSLLLIPFLALLVAPLRAQTSLDVGPLAGYYRPLGNFTPASVYSTSLPSRPGDLSGGAWGGTAQLAFRGRLGVEAQAAVARSTIPSVITPEGSSHPTGAQVLVVSSQVEYDVSPDPRRYRIWVGAGPAVVRHGGDAYNAYGAPTSAAGALGIGVTAPIGAHVRLAAGATTLLYSLTVKMPPELRGNPGSLEHGFQTDALLHLGIRWVPR